MEISYYKLPKQKNISTWTLMLIQNRILYFRIDYLVIIFAFINETSMRLNLIIVKYLSLYR